MKKITKTIFGLTTCVLGLSCIVSGCATVSSIKNSDKEIIYNGTSAVLVDDYLYYGNTFSDFSTFEKDNDYKNATKLSYLSRLNTGIDMSAKTKDYSPSGVEKVADEVVSQTNSFMFVLGNYIYYATPNRQKLNNEDGVSSFYFNYSTIYRSELNGNNKKKIYTPVGEISQIEVLKYENKYYIVLLAGTNLVKIELGNKTKTTVISENATSAAFPKTYQKNKLGSSLNWNGDIYFTVDKTIEDSETYLTGSIVKKVSVADEEQKQVYFKNGATISFVGRERDQLFYTMTGDETETFMFDSNSTGTAVFGQAKDRFSSSSISAISLIATESANYGYIYKTSSGIGYVSSNGSRYGNISFLNNSETLSTYNVLMISGRTIYLSTTTGILKADLSNVFNSSTSGIQSFEISCEAIVTMTAIYDGSLYAFDGTYIYYYAKLEQVETDEDETESETEETDDNYYMYRAKVGSVDSYQLLSLTKYSSRHS